MHKEAIQISLVLAILAGLILCWGRWANRTTLECERDCESLQTKCANSVFSQDHQCHIEHMLCMNRCRPQVSSHLLN